MPGISYQVMKTDAFSVLPEWAQLGLLGLCVVAVIGLVIWAIYVFKELDK